MRKKKIILTESDRKKISLKFFELFVNEEKVIFPKSTYQIVRLYNKFGLEQMGIAKEKLTLFVIEIEKNKLRKIVAESQIKTDKFTKYFKLN